MKINGVWFNAELPEILVELQNQLNSNNIELLQKTKETGTHIQVQCPYHANGKERRPSAGIRKEDGVFHCFACGEIHGLPEVISYCFGQNDILGKFGWNWLLKNFATVSVEERKDVTLDFHRDNKYPSDSNSIPYIAEEELDKYRYTHPYMYQRGLTDEIIALFDIGYDKDLGCITFPVRDKDGNCLFIARRAVKFKYYNYPKNVEKPLYGLYEFYKTSDKNEIIVCEGMFDALTCWVYGRPAVALNGTGSSLQMKQLRELSIRKIILAMDNDKAGQNAKIKIRDYIPNKLITEFVLPPYRKDINELTRKEFMALEEVFC